MVANDVRAALKAQPFAPFDIRLSDGRSLPVPHPDFAAMSPDKWELIIFRQGGGWDYVDIGSITSLQFRGRNGKGKKKQAN